MLVVLALDAEVQPGPDVRQPILASLFEKASDFGVLVDLDVCVEIGLEAVEVPVGEVLEGRLHGGSKGGISILEIALTLVSGLGARGVVDFGTATTTCGGLSPGAGRSSTPCGAASASATTSLGRAGSLNNSVTHGGVAIQIVRLWVSWVRERAGRVWCRGETARQEQGFGGEKGNGRVQERRKM